MNKLAIKHVPMSEDAHGINSYQIVIRIRSAKDDLQTCYLWFGDRACRQTPVKFTSVCMERVLYDEYFDYYEVTLTNVYKRL